MRQLTPAEIDLLTFADIERMKQEIHLELSQQREMFVERTKSVGQTAAFMKGGTFMNRLRMGYTIFSGIMTGVRMVRTLRRQFR